MENGDRIREMVRRIYFKDTSFGSYEPRVPKNDEFIDFFTMQMVELIKEILEDSQVGEKEFWDRLIAERPEDRPQMFMMTEGAKLANKIAMEKLSETTKKASLLFYKL